MELIDIVIKLTGPIHPVGETNQDVSRFNNLKTLCELSEKIMDRIFDVSYHNKSRVEHSMNKAGIYAFTHMVLMRDSLKDNTEG